VIHAAQLRNGRLNTREFVTDRKRAGTPGKRGFGKLSGLLRALLTPPPLREARNGACLVRAGC